MNTNENQPELFQELNKENNQVKRKRNFLIPLLSERQFSFSIDKIIIFATFIIMFNVICFSLGIEKGKNVRRYLDTQDLPKVETTEPDAQKVTERKNTSEKIIAADKNALTTASGLNTPPEKSLPMPEAAKEIKTPVKETAKKDLLQPQKTYYTIQIATFKDFESAKKEATKVTAKGFTAEAVKGQKYTYVCVGKFKAKEEAQSTLTRVKKYYTDCFVKKI